MMLVCLIACAGSPGEPGPSDVYIHKATGLSFPARLGKLSRFRPNSDVKFDLGPVEIVYLAGEVPLVSIAIVKIRGNDDPTPEDLLNEIGYYEGAPSMKFDLAEKGTVNTRCNGADTDFSYTISENEAAAEVRFGVIYQRFFVYIRKYIRVARPSVAVLLGEILNDFGFPCQMTAS